MPEGRSYSEVRLDVDPHSDAHARMSAEPQSERIFRLGICGAFSGRTSASAQHARVWRIDRDDFDEVLATVAPTLQLELGKGMVVDVRIRELDDFHPDQLFERVPQFARLRELRAELADPRTFSRAAAELSSPVPTPASVAAFPSRWRRPAPTSRWSAARRPTTPPPTSWLPAGARC